MRRKAVATKTLRHKKARGGAAKTARATVETTARAIVLLSGGLDSSTCLLIARSEGFEIHALSFDYGQRHAIELERARSIASRYGAASHRIARIDFPAASASALTDPSIPVPRDALGREPIPITYVPARNTLFLAHAVAWGESLGAHDVFIGANALDYSGYPDCRPEFLEAFEKTANLGTRAGAEGAPFRIHAPLLRLGKADIVRRAALLGLDFASTLSCYDPASGGAPCGSCDACLLRRKGFEQAGIPDPLEA
jgi:7-cyano-7-deazaguanine synthase